MSETPSISLPNSTVVPQTSSHVVRIVMYVIFSLGIIAMTVLFETRAQRITVNGVHQSANEQGSFVIKTDAKQSQSVVLDETVLLQVAPNTELIVAHNGKNKRDISLVIAHGKIWVNAENSTATVRVLTKSLVAYESQINLEVSGAIAEVEYGDLLLHIKALHQTVYAYFLKTGLVVHDGTEISISESKLQRAGKDIAQLRYAKLAKEFPLSVITSFDDWEKVNGKGDTTFHKKLTALREEELRDAGQRVSFDTKSTFTAVKDVLFAGGLLVTMSDTKKQERMVQLTSDYINTAAYALLIGNEKASKELLSRASVVFSSIDESICGELCNPKNKRVLLEPLREQYAFARPGEAFYPIYLFVTERGTHDLFAELKRDFAAAVKASHDGDDALTEQRVISQLQILGSHLGGDGGSRISYIEQGKHTAQELLLFARDVRAFIMGSSTLLREQYLKIVDQLEIDYLAVATDADAANDERQFLISDKLFLLKLIKSNVEKGKIPFQDGRKAMIHLATRIDILKPSLSQAAFIQYFDKQYSDVIPFISFLRSTDAREIVGDYQPYFKAYQLKISESQQVQSLLKSAEGGITMPGVDRERIAAKVVADLGTVGMEKIRVIFSDEQNNPIVRVTDALFESKPITLVYNTDSQTLSEIIIDGQAISNALPLNQARTYLLIKLGKLKMPQGTTDESFTVQVKDLSAVEKVAINRVTTELAKVGVSVKESDIGTQDIDKDIMHITSALIGTGSDAIIASFDVVNKFSVAQNIKVKTVLGELPINQAFALREFPAKISSVYEGARLEQQRQTELNNLVK